MGPWHGYVLFFLLALSLTQSSVTASIFRKKHHVFIENGLDNYTLQAHCKSKDDDLGLHAIPPKGLFQWHFYGNFWLTTLFFCNTWWHSGQRVFDVYDMRNRELCNYCNYADCHWRAANDGVYLYNYENSSYMKMYEWVK
ncbi:hypothetical protein L1049_005402 [Liquidambar formosana]|uniref:S-protein homolog n=1 Tax=Liquidambar formosana TaxID=63359 RepID=A0AAP0RVC7_LIQFO